MKIVGRVIVMLIGISALNATGPCIGRVEDSGSGQYKDYYDLHYSMNLFYEYWDDGQPMAQTIDYVMIAENYEASICKGRHLFDCIKLQGAETTGSSYKLSDYGYGNQVVSLEYRRNTPLFDDYYYNSNYPGNKEYCIGTQCLNQLVQGVAHDGSYWYFTNKWSIFKIPLSVDLDDDPRNYRVAGLPDGCDHFGDLDYYNGKLYVPLEGCTSYNGNPTRLYVYDAANPSVPEKWVRLSGHHHLAWVSVHPDTGQVYAQWEFDNYTLLPTGQIEWDNYPYVDVYPDITSVPTGTIVYEENCPRLQDASGNTVYARRVQGGKISSNNYLYLVSDNKAETGNAGIWVFKIEERKAIFKGFIPPNGYDPSDHEEMEGIDLFDVGGLGIPGIPYGQIHWLLLDYYDFLDADDFYFKHVSVYPPDNI